jgi:TusA-related sulfurtransferase
MASSIGQTVGIQAELDIRGEVCPYTFVKTKLALENLRAGQVLKVVVDNDESGENVPRSVTLEGHRVLDARKVNATDWAILVQRA